MQPSAQYSRVPLQPLHARRTVSYTHLDVYKRQVLVVKKFSIAEYVATATKIVAAMVEAL